MAPTVDVNIIAVLIAAVISMVIGSLWYSPLLFGKAWMKLMKFSEKHMKEAKKRGMAKLYLIGFISSLVMSYVLAHFIDYVQASSISEGMQTGFWIWIGFFATTMLGSVLWEGRPFKLYAINILYQLVNLAVMGAILAVWV